VARIYATDRDGPGTHALVIGVGGYDHLRGGVSDRKLARSTRYGNLGQLTSPPKSAWALAEFLASSRPMNWLVPLSTIELLISAAPADDDPGGAGGPYERATRAAIQHAFDCWWDRCDANPDNVAIFYFCGHGLQAANQVLLASDFGATGNPWQQAFDLNKTREAFKANRARTQLFLIDACREITTSTVEVPSPNAPPLREPEARQTEYCEHDLTVQATSRTKKAYGKEGEVSYFTRAVLHAFRGAAKKQNGSWWVRSDQIAGRIEELVKLAGGTDQRPIVTTSSPTWLYRLDEVPEVTFEFGCSPAEALRSAKLAYWRIGGGERQQRPRSNATPWKLLVPAGLYQLEATFPDRSFQDATDGISLEPPVWSERLPVR
jgi:hypothetical protein